MKARWCLAWIVGLLLVAGCNGNPDPDPKPCQPVPDVAGKVTFTGLDQLKVTWPDMPGVKVGGGDESCVLRRRVEISMKAAREIATISTLMLVDVGDHAEGAAIVYNQGGQKLYERAPHWTGDEPFEGSHSAPPLIPGQVTKLYIDILHRTLGNNAQGEPTSRPHYEVTVSFVPGQTCEIPPEHDPRWKVVGSSKDNPKVEDGTLDFDDTRAQLDVAKATVGDRSGNDPTQTLVLLAKAINEAGGCAMQWADELLIMRDATTGDSFHAVAFGTGGYAGRPDRDRWTVGEAPSSCGFPDPSGRPGKINLKPHNNWWDSTIKVCSADYCNQSGSPGMGCCPVRPEGDPERAVCEERLNQKWWCDGLPVLAPCSTSSAPCLKDSNPAQAKCFGHVKTCIDGGVCSENDWAELGPLRKAGLAVAKGSAEISERSKVAIVLILGYVFDFLQWLW